MIVIKRRQSFVIRDSSGKFLLDCFTKSQGKKELRKVRKLDDGVALANGINEILLGVKLFD